MHWLRRGRIRKVIDGPHRYSSAYFNWFSMSEQGQEDDVHADYDQSLLLMSMYKLSSSTNEF